MYTEIFLIESTEIVNLVIIPNNILRTVNIGSLTPTISQTF